MLEKTILSNLILNEEFGRKVFPYLKEEYFEDISFKKVFETAAEYIEEYKAPPSIEALKIALDKRKDLNEDMYTNTNALIEEEELANGTPSW